MFNNLLLITHRNHLEMGFLPEKTCKSSEIQPEIQLFHGAHSHEANSHQETKKANTRQEAP